jgi:hypothetical protein
MRTSIVALISPLALGLAFSVSTWAQAPAANDAPAQPEGVEVLARGPVHEAFAEPAIRGPRPTPLVPKAPPEPIEELPPEQKPAGDNVQWIPGYWAWDEERADYLWVSGTWRAVPPDRQWLPGHWNQANRGWQWVAGYWHPAGQQTVEFLPQPPDPVAEAMTPAPGPFRDNVYVPGTWIFRDNRYVWRPGFWMGYRPGWVWIPAHYLWTPGGFLFVEGYWDFALANRGLLFAPVFLTPRSYLRPGWSYRPSYVLLDDFLTSALFVRLTTNHYYFGDYFDPRYTRLGFTPWVDFRINRTFYDPLFAYFRWHHRADPAVEQDLQQLYAARREGRAPRPPQTLAQQQTLAKNRTTSTSRNNVTPLVPLNQAKTTVKLQPVPSTQLVAERQAVKELRALSRERSQVEADVAAQRSPRAGTARTPGPVKVELARVKLGSPTTGSVNAAPPPPLPAAVIHHTAAKPSTPEGKPLPPDLGKPTGERPVVLTPEPKPVRDVERPPVVKPEPKPAPPKPDKPAPEAKPALKPPPPKAQDPKPGNGKQSDKDKKPN